MCTIIPRKKNPTPEYKGEIGGRNDYDHFIIIFYHAGDLVVFTVLVEGVKTDIIGV